MTQGRQPIGAELFHLEAQLPSRARSHYWNRIGTCYNACTGFDGGFPNTSNQFGSSDPSPLGWDPEQLNYWVSCVGQNGIANGVSPLARGTP